MFTLKIKTENAAFEDKRLEVARILHKIADDLEHRSDTESIVQDGNGNTVGKWTLK